MKGGIKCRTPGPKIYPVLSSVIGATGSSLQQTREFFLSTTMRPYVRPVKMRKKKGTITRRCRNRPSGNVLLIPKCNGVIPRDIAITISIHSLVKNSTSLGHHPDNPLPGVRFHSGAPNRHRKVIRRQPRRFELPGSCCGRRQSHRHRHGK